MTKSVKKRVLFVDRRREFRHDILNRIDVSENFQCVGYFQDVKSAQLSLLRTRPELICITLDSCDDWTLTIISKMKLCYPGVKIIVQSDVDDDQVVFGLLTIGLAGFTRVCKSVDAVMKVLQKAAGGGHPISPGLVKRIFENFQLNKFSELSMRQNEVLRLMILGGTYNSIASRLQISKETAKTHMKNLYRKLDVHSKEEALAKAVEEKIIMVI